MVKTERPAGKTQQSWLTPPKGASAPGGHLSAGGRAACSLRVSASSVSPRAALAEMKSTEGDTVWEGRGREEGGQEVRD